MSSIAIETVNLKRTFKTYKKPEGFRNSVKGFFTREYIEKTALHETNLQLHSGQIIGLVGANGAGKTTLLKILSGLIASSSGSARVMGLDPWKRDKNYLRQISILLGQKNQLWWDLPAADSFAMLTRIYELDEQKAKAHYLRLSEILGCTEQLHIQLRRLSLGERMKMEIIGCLLHQPRVLFLDEPTIGLDIVAQNAIRVFLKEYSQLYKPTVILTSHYMDDIALLADKLLLITKGRIVYDGTVNEFSRQTKEEKKLHIILKEPNQQSFTLGAQQIEVGQQEFTVKVASGMIGKSLSTIAQYAEIKDLRTEETDFEDVIHQFFQKN